MAIDKKGSGRGKQWPTKPAPAGEDGTPSTSSSSAKQPAQKAWSKRVQEAPQPLSAKHIAAAKEKKNPVKAAVAKEGGAEAEVKKGSKKVAAVVAAAEEEVVVGGSSPAVAGGKKRKAAAAGTEEESTVVAPSPSTSKSAAKPSPSTKKAKTTTTTEASSSKSTKKSAAAPVASKAKLHFLKDDPIPLLKGLETQATQAGYHSTSEDDEDSSDDEDESDGEGADSGPVEGIELMKLPTIAKDDASVKRKLERARKTGDKEKGVLYLGRIPHGFYETEMKAYFSQFGDVEKIRLARNKKTGKSKHYGFLLFESLSVAKIVAETMDNYLLLGHILRCKVVPNSEIHPSLWVGANRKWRAVPSVRLERAKLEQPRTKEQQVKAEKRLLSRQEAKKAKLAELGIDYQMEGVEYKQSA
ncbi:hypothetical protein BDY24DRAFT_404361 [Mrakia frigida]|uniref:uncharacterized protein n=1 Tax=Mrakia frigida TaxID=29902 RepID=UPI003FCC03D9